MTEIPAKKPAGKWSQAIIAIEAIIYSLPIFILMLPVYIGSYGYKAIKWLGSIIPGVLIKIITWFAVIVVGILSWIIINIIHSIYIIIFVITGVVIDLCVAILLYVCGGIRALYILIKNYWSKINWCAVRSTVRIVAIICIIGSIYTIIEGILQCPEGTVILTGRFFDANGTVFRIHEAIALLMVSITAFYNAWAYSKDEEVSFICAHTFGVSALNKIINKVLNKQE